MAYNYQEKKITAVISDKLSQGLAMNALGHLAFSAGRYADQSWMGKETIHDADGQEHKGISKYPFIVLKGSEEEIKNIIKKAKEEKIFVVDYTQEMFDTGHDEELVEALSKAKELKLQYHAAVLVGNAEKIKMLTKHLKLYK